jgi:HSP90 family molecular chaperone
LIQNANDAGATKVEINFSTTAATTTTTTSSQYWTKHQVVSISCRNNGRPFSAEDWNRLKKIAEGNPDVDKIGFFGVGFYSLFSICEEPLCVPRSYLKCTHVELK